MRGPGGAGTVAAMLVPLARSGRRRAAFLVLGMLAVGAPWGVAAVAPGQQRYVVHVLIFTALFAALALSYDLVVGHVGSLSLAHPAFFGVGAYTAAILSTRAGWPFVADLTAAVLLAGAVAAAAGVPLFRLVEHSFAVGTLAFAVVVWIVATNWVEVTRGPLCITGVPKPALGLPGGPTLAITTLPGYYWVTLGALGGVALLYRGLTTFRLGRAFHAVRDNEPLAAAAGINPLKYRMLAFTVGGAVAGGVGALYAHYLSVVCPEEMTVALTVNLLVIVFLGGVGSLRGVLLGAALFTALPEVLRLAPTWRLVIYGALLLVIVIRSPEGLEGLLRRPAARGDRG
jgi:branched-chain amino acid transport system permease protein